MVKGIIKNASYENRVYKSVDDRSQLGIEFRLYLKYRKKNSCSKELKLKFWIYAFIIAFIVDYHCSSKDSRQNVFKSFDSVCIIKQ